MRYHPPCLRHAFKCGPVDCWLSLLVVLLLALTGTSHCIGMAVIIELQYEQMTKDVEESDHAMES
jgi:sulfite exporter TauE/SafE